MMTQRALSLTASLACSYEKCLMACKNQGGDPSCYYECNKAFGISMLNEITRVARNLDIPPRDLIVALKAELDRQFESELRSLAPQIAAVRGIGR